MTVVAGALIDAHARVLMQQRPPGSALPGLWEFPGGKIEPGETPRAALVRELAEELGITVAPDDCAPVTFAEEALADGRHLLLLLYRVTAWTGAPRAVQATGLRWGTAAELAGLPMPPADRPLLGALSLPA